LSDRLRREPGLHHGAREGFAFRQYRILEIEHQGVARLAVALASFLSLSAGHKQH